MTNKSNKNLLLQYLGLASQLIVTLAILVYLGYKGDGYFNLAFPLLVWLLPLCGIVAMMVKVFKDTSKK